MREKNIVLACSICLLSLLLFGCGPKTTVILLPEDDGKLGNVVVESEGGAVTIDQERGSTTVSGTTSAPSKQVVVTQEYVEKKYGDTLANLPEQPHHFILYFKSESVQLTSTSKKQFPEIVRYIKENDPPDIGVIAHTDTAGDKNYNMRLSKRRANEIKRLLVQQGIDPAIISTSYHGENNPLIKTPDNTHERRNRRVEVIAR